MKSLFMENTEIPPERTISEIEAVLIQHGANAVLKEYVDGSIEAVSFRIKIGGQDVPFRLPCRYKAIAQIFHDRAERFASERDVESRNAKARRVAWRQILRWVQAQLALVETKMVKVEEVFFPYIQTHTGQTIYELHQGNLLQLGSGRNE